jgi:hypothetical protein
MSGHDHQHHHDHHGEIHPHQLEPPHEVFHDDKAGEIVRAWITHGNLSLALHAMAFGKADTWGHVLAGIAQNVAHVCAEQGQGSMASNIENIRKILLDDLAKAAAGASAIANR